MSEGDGDGVCVFEGVAGGESVRVGVVVDVDRAV